jgi:tetratricopeptide (TPR) repeat protein
MRCHLNLMTATMLAAMLMGAGLAFAAKHSPIQRQSPAHPQLRLSADDLLQLDQRMRDIARDEITPGLASANADAEHSEREADRVISYSTYAITAWAAIATIILAVVTGFGLYGYGQLREAEQRLASASEAVTRANNAATNAEGALARIESAETHVVLPAKKRMEQLARSIDNALRDIKIHDSSNVKAYFTRIEQLEHTTVMGEPPEFPPAQYVKAMEEADAVIIIAMRIGVIDQVELAPVFVKLGNYWDHIENYARAIARYQRAVELDPGAWEAFFGLSRTYCGLASRADTNPDAKRRQLALADNYCEAAEQKIPAADVRLSVHRGWIVYENGDLARAIEHFRSALALDPERKRAVVSYNLSATLAKVGRFAEALDELEPVIARDDNWEAAATDTDFVDLLADQGVFGNRFRELLEEGRHKGKQEGRS